MKLLFALALAATLVGCNSSVSATDSGSGVAAGNSTTKTENSAMDQKSTTPPDAQTNSAIDRQPKDGEDVAVMETSLGKVVLMFFPDKAPKHVENFEKLAKKGFYDGTKFHRVIPGFMIQGGDPNTKSSDTSKWGMGGPGYQIDAEFNDVHHARGILSMARSQDPNSAGSQFFIVVKDSGFLDNQYTVFGKVVSGMDVVDKIVNLPRNAQDRPNDPPVIKSLKIEKWPLK